MLNSYDIFIKGKVQGVWFRKYTQEKAKTLQLKGFVRNELNGSVYVHVEGAEQHIAEFIDWLHIGSPLSKVTAVELMPGELRKFTSFEIHR